ncbi:hypothetical protein [Caproiciproducens faecalis]|uniref:DUF5666 domain-containing protein n=1 Tax=Caproiciproducens faecalis TaxID=2820301 RepID=A0ABS7DRE1_9FIRM|nr:hypothetical protein [Caproiciproducens faecalis]MBW7573866.1 hypothetical protein [Caproiciproducens faecalis]
MMDSMVKRVGAVLLAAVCAVSLAACSSQAAAADTASQSASGNDTDNQTTVYGKVTAVNGSKITLVLGTLNRGEGGQRREGGNQSGASRSGEKGNPPSKNSTGSGSSHSESQNPKQSDSGKAGNLGLLTLTGETKTITISDESVVTKQNMHFNRQAPNGKAEQGTGSSTSSTGDTSDTYSTKGINNTDGNAKGESASLNDITVGSILKVTTETGTDKLVSVQILSGGTGEKPVESGTSSQS